MTLEIGQVFWNRKIYVQIKDIQGSSIFYCKYESDDMFYFEPNTTREEVDVSYEDILLEKSLDDFLKLIKVYVLKEKYFGKTAKIGITKRSLKWSPFRRKRGYN